MSATYLLVDTINNSVDLGQSPREKNATYREFQALHSVYKQMFNCRQFL